MCQDHKPNFFYQMQSCKNGCLAKNLGNLKHQKRNFYCKSNWYCRFIGTFCQKVICMKVASNDWFYETTKVTYPKYYKHWLNTLANTIYCSCRAYFDPNIFVNQLFNVDATEFYFFFVHENKKKTNSNFDKNVDIPSVFLTAQSAQKKLSVLTVLGTYNIGNYCVY